MNNLDVNDLTKEVGKITDNLTSTSEERDSELTERLRIDMQSDNPLAKMIRPITLIVFLVLEGFIVIASAFDKTVDIAISTEVSLILITIIGFYFESRKREKIAERNAKANMQIEVMKQRETRKERRHERRMERIRERKQ